MLPFFKSNVTDDFQCIKQVLESNFLSEGKITEKFENELKKYLKVKYCATVNSGTSAIHLALIAAGVKADDEVILPPQTFIASALPILYLKAKPVFADINLDNGNICHLSIKKKITKKTKAIIVVHWGGYPCDLDEIKKVKKNKNIKIIEDAAHCFGGSYKKKKIGCISDFTCFSFQAIKHLTTADGGLVCCKTKKDETFLKKIRWFGINRFSKRKLDGSRNNEDIKLIGYKYHLNNYSAALGLANLKKSKQILNHHISIGNYYTKKLNNINGIKILKFIDNRIHTFWFYQILVKNRKKFIKLLNEINFPCSIVDKRIDKNTIFRTYSRKLKNQDIFEKKKIALPVNMEIKKKHIDKLANYLRKNYQI